MGSSGVLIILCFIAAVLPLQLTEAGTFDFAQFKTCKKCIGAGFGWCSIQRICGGFANRNCGEGPRFHRADYDPATDPEAEEEEEEEKLVKKPTKKKTAPPPPPKKKSDSDGNSISSGKILPLKVEDINQAVEKNNMDYWAFYFYDKSVEVGGLGNKLSLSLEQWGQIAKSTKRINLLVSAINIESLKESAEWKKSTADTTSSSVWSLVKRALMNTAGTLKPCIVMLLDNRDDPLPLLQLSGNNEFVANGNRNTIENVVQWMNNEIGSAVMSRATGDEKRRRDGLKQKKKETTPPPPPSSKEKKTQPPPPKIEEKKSEDSGSRKFSFDNFKTCQECIGAGFGWCSIQRICGGFANQQCGEGPRFHRADYDPEAAANAAGESSGSRGKVEGDDEAWEDPFEDSF